MSVGWRKRDVCVWRKEGREKKPQERKTTQKRRNSKDRWVREKKQQRVQPATSLGQALGRLHQISIVRSAAAPSSRPPARRTLLERGIPVARSLVSLGAARCPSSLQPARTPRDWHLPSQRIDRCCSWTGTGAAVVRPAQVKVVVS